MRNRKESRQTTPSGSNTHIIISLDVVASFEIAEMIGEYSGHQTVKGLRHKQQRVRHWTRAIYCTPIYTPSIRRPK